MGTTAEDALVTLQMAPFGDRVSLIAYGALNGKSGRITAVNPLFFELVATSVAAAAELAEREHRRFSRIIDRRAGLTELPD